MVGHKPLSPAHGRIVVLLAFMLSFASAGAQVVEVAAGPPPGELQCPYRAHHAPPKPPKHAGEPLEPPRVEDLAALPDEGESQPQEIAVGRRARPDASQPDLSPPLAIALWGDSHTASDAFSEEFVRVLGYARDQVQPTFVPPDMDRAGVRLPIHKHCQGDGWSLEYAYLSRQSGAHYAKGLVNLKSSVPDSYLWVDFRALPPTPNLRSLDILFAPPGAGEKNVVGIAVDDGAEQVVELEQAGMGIVHLRAEHPMSTVKLRLIAGTLVLQGFVPQYVEVPRLYFDTLSIPGATARGWRMLDPEFLMARDNEVSYDLVIMEYGTNEGNDRSLDLDKYRADLRASLQNLRRVYPASACVLIGPPDRGVLVQRRHGKKKRHDKPSPTVILKYSRIHQKLGVVQRAVAAEYSCSYWSWQEAMGGPGAAYRWVHRSPPWMARDLTHLTVAGYQASARKFAATIRLPK